MIKITDKTKIFVMTPPNFVSGGPELLHQLVFQLRSIGYNAFTYYHPLYVKTEGELVSPLNDIYKNQIVTSIVDDSDNIIIVPEIYSYFKTVFLLKNVQKILWWLSVDNYFLDRSRCVFPDSLIHLASRQINKFISKNNKIDITALSINLHKNRKLLNDKFLLQFSLHFVQSIYAKDKLLSEGIDDNKIFYLSDYLNDIYLNMDSENSADRENIVLYNPAKGYSFTKKIIKKAPHINFVPIINLTYNEVLELLKKSKIYIDFGNHPGKDRMPREAAMAGCCIISGKRGSAKNDFDLEIPKEYKFDSDNIEGIIKMIDSCLTEYKSHYIKFNFYRNKIIHEKASFVEDLLLIFNN